MEIAELMVHTSLCLITANDTESAIRHETALRALANVRRLSFDIYVGSNGMPPSRSTLPVIVSGSAAVHTRVRTCRVPTRTRLLHVQPPHCSHSPRHASDPTLGGAELQADVPARRAPMRPLRASLVVPLAFAPGVTAFSHA
jgi:hypothetical protein